VGIQGTYPHYELAGTRWIGKTVLHQPKCKCCGDDIGEELLEILVKRAAGKKVKGVHLTIRGIPEYFTRTGRPFTKQSLTNHMAHHIVVMKLSELGSMEAQVAAASKAKEQAKNRGNLPMRKENTSSERDELLRKAVDEDQMEPSESAVTKGSHMVYLEKVVRVAQHVVEQFPERVTPEMGIRAAAEIAKQRQNDSTEALIDLLVTTGSVGQGKAARVGPAGIVREIEGSTEVVEDAEYSDA
jgi:hypothetical protein